jgi:hypothetical protein
MGAGEALPFIRLCGVNASILSFVSVRPISIRPSGTFATVEWIALAPMTKKEIPSKTAQAEKVCTKCSMLARMGVCSCTVLYFSMKPRPFFALSMSPTLPSQRDTSFATTPALAGEGTIPRDSDSETSFGLLTPDPVNPLPIKISSMSSDGPWSLAETGEALTEVVVSFPPFFFAVSFLSLMKLWPKAKEGALHGPSVLGLFVGSVIGLRSVGCTVGGGFVGNSVGASVALENHSEEEYDE